jgi:hypothetical protein
VPVGVLKNANAARSHCQLPAAEADDFCDDRGELLSAQYKNVTGLRIDDNVCASAGYFMNAISKI